MLRPCDRPSIYHKLGLKKAFVINDPPIFEGMVESKSKEKFILLKDKRKLGFKEYGVLDGFPIIYCHGSQSSRLEMHYDLTFAQNHHLRIITIDRPGHGLSDYNPKGSIIHFAEDVKQLLSSLNITKFSVAGMSAGAPFALGIAYCLPTMVHKTSIISGFAPYNTKSKKHLSKEVNTILQLAKNVPLLLRLLLKIQAKHIKRKPKQALASFLKIMSPPDQLILKNGEVMKLIEAMFKEAFRNGGRGVAFEISKILVQDWGFSLDQINIPVHFWHGEKDNNVPFEWAVLMDNSIKHSKLTSYENEGHLIIFEHADEIFADLKYASK